MQSPTKRANDEGSPLKDLKFCLQMSVITSFVVRWLLCFFNTKKTEIGSVVLFFLILPGLSPPEFPSVVDSPLDLGEPFEPEKNPYKMARWIQL